MKFTINDGGRAAAGFRGKAGDCGVRAVAIATGHDYAEVYKAVDLLIADGVGARKGRKPSARTGVFPETVGAYLTQHGFKWVPTMGIGTGCKVHANGDELPKGRLVLRVSKHYVAMIDGVVHDTHDCTRDGTRCVYGYWVKA